MKDEQTESRHQKKEDFTDEQIISKNEKKKEGFTEENTESQNEKKRTLLTSIVKFQTRKK